MEPTTTTLTATVTDGGVASAKPSTQDHDYWTGQRLAHAKAFSRPRDALAQRLAA